MFNRKDNFVWYEYNDKLENWVDKNAPDVQKFIASATPKQMEYFEIACKILTLTNDIVVKTYTDDVHLQKITTFLVENENADFMKFLKEAHTVKDYLNVIDKMDFNEDNDVYYNYLIDVNWSIEVAQYESGNYYYRPSQKIA